MRGEVSIDVDRFLQGTPSFLNSSPFVKWWSERVGDDGYNGRAWVQIAELFIIASEVLEE